MKKQKIELSGKERFIINEEILPQNGSRIDMIMAKEIHELLKIKSSEIQEIGMIEKGGRVYFNDEKQKNTKDFEFSDMQISFLKKCVEKMGKENEQRWTRFNTETCIRIENL